jgi:sugar phosphate isomerase/epimerase
MSIFLCRRSLDAGISPILFNFKEGFPYDPGRKAQLLIIDSMRQTSRKDFLQTTAMVLGATIVGNKMDLIKDKQLLAFSTIGCPDWSLSKIVDFAWKHNYHGIEVRGLKRELNLPKCPEFSSSAIQSTMKLMEDKKLRFVDLGSSSTLHFAEGADREKNLADGKAFIDLAQQLNCPNVRVYPNLLPKDRDKDEVMDFIVKGLLELGSYAKASGTMVLMETHGDLVWAHDIETIMKNAAHSNVGLVWDFCNMWRITKEPPGETYRLLKKYIHHTHIKDAKLVNGKPQYTRLGQGEIPVAEAIEALVRGGYKGYYSFEWEKLWHPELEDPESALADYPIAMKRYFRV